MANNAVRQSELPDVIGAVHAALTGLGKPARTLAIAQTPAVPVRRSVTPDNIVSLEDGRPYKSLKRHLAALGLTPLAYRQKWNPPSDYPMVAANYAKKRSELARSMGLGRKRADVVEAEPAAEIDAAPAEIEAMPEAPAVVDVVEAEAPPPKRRGRPKKAAASSVPEA